ncbi:MAG: AI-2E family transporter [Hyphomicrobiaceae bacterium]|nr:AI-2E family transporter [Hyphomicrobiaceae bacterium]
MSISRQTLFWASALVVLLLIVAVLHEILLPFILGAAIAYLLDPLADWLEGLGLSRLLATVLIMLLFSLVVIIGLIVVLPLLVEQLVDLATRMPEYLQSLRDLAINTLKGWFGDKWLTAKLQLDGTIKELAQKATGWAGGLLTSVLSGGLAVVNFIALLVITPVVAFYLLLDWDRMMQHISDWLPRDHADAIRQIGRDIDEVISGFVRGQFTVLMILGLFYVIGLTLIGLNFGLLIGLGAGLVSFIPFVGPVVGFVVGGTVAVVQFWPDWHWVAAVIGVFLVGQAIEGNILSPMIVGDRVRLHPVWLMFALFVFGYLFGFVGMLLAVPVAAAIGVLVRFGLQLYLKSSLYQGEAKPKRKKKPRPVQ